MSSNAQRDLIYLIHILEAMETIEEYTSDLDETAFSGRKIVQDGVIRQLEIIGEASKNLSQEIKRNYSSVPWKDIAGLRDKLIHQYFGVDLEVVWRVINTDIPEVKPVVRVMVDSLNDPS